MEQFSWLSDLRVQKDGSVVAATGPGYVTMGGEGGACAAVADFKGEARHPGHLVAAAALLYLTDGIEHRFVMLERDQGARFEPGKWQFPAGHSAPNELPLRTASRELAEEVRIQGEHASWKEVLISVGGNEVDFLTQDTVHHLRARYVISGRTIEFYYPMALLVTAFDRVQLSDNEPYGRRVALLSPREIARLALDDMLTEPARLIVEKEFSEFLQVLRDEHQR